MDATKRFGKDTALDKVLRFRVSLAALVGLLILASIVYPSSSGWLRFVLNALGYTACAAIFLWSRVTYRSVGLGISELRKGLVVGGLISLAIFFGFLACYLILPDLFHDNRYHQTLPTALYASFILLPLKTVIFEEFAFRGLLPALLKGLYGYRISLYVSPLMFGLWHVLTSVHVGNYHVGDYFVVPGALFTLGAIIATSVAGYIFLQLRLKTGSLVTPILVHWTINASAIIFASFSWT